ncbi:hypothetical protein BGZ95_009014 [Linnemannia exigua]|uniref:Uncharacterized protein n=1 Tax=Linnemannia exigua TaxID=604196 RepID=A0AAD4H622_9FUNG|nr:hypothetical protein BGZ95_009014 [Linnemannia exigua]
MVSALALEKVMRAHKPTEKRTGELLQMNLNQLSAADMDVVNFILLKNNHRVPSDDIILSTSEAEGLCFIETKDLDGETSLKIPHQRQRAHLQGIPHHAGQEALTRQYYWTCLLALRKQPPQSLRTLDYLQYDV